MAITYLKQPKSFGQSFAEGATNSLQRLVSGRLQQIENQNEQRDFATKLRAAYPNYSEQEAWIDSASGFSARPGIVSA